jgi:hypothetical protein
MDYTGKVITKNPVTPTQASASGVWTLDEALQAQKGNNWPVPGVYNPISRSLRFNSADSAYLNWTPTFVGNRRTWTLSFWLKRTTLGTAVTETILATNDDNLASGNFDNIRLTTTGGITDKLEFYSYSTGYSIRLITTQVFRDPSAWYHFVIAVDTTQSTASNRVKIYLNGSQITAFTTETYPSQNYQTYINNAERQNLGVLRNVGSGLSQYLNGYMTEVNFIDGQALTPSDVGLTDPATGVWVPKKYTGTYGGNGFYMNFKDSATTTALGYDYSGNGNNWTPNNFSVTAGAGNDSLTDVPTLWLGYSTGGDTGGVVRGNYCTWNPLERPDQSSGTYTVTLSNGNLDTAAPGSEGSALNTTLATFQIPTTGKWYWEILVTNVATSAPTRSTIGIMNQAAKNNDGADMYYAAVAGVYAYSADGQKAQSYGTLSSYGNSYTNNDIISVAVDSDDGKIWFAKNGTWQNSGSPTSGTNAAFTGLVMTGGFQPATGYWLGCTANFGQRPFAYTPPAGYRSLCTTNLPTPAIGTSSTTQANDYFNPVLYNGTGATLGVTGVGFQPDFVWIKSRSAATDHALYDVVRGDKNQLESNNSDAETTETTGLTQFNADGFTVGTLAQVNTNSATYVSWNWKAGGNGVTNTAGSITSTVSANTTAGFSIVTYTGNGTSGATVGHGCQVNGVATAPRMMIFKQRSGTTSWPVYHASLTSANYALFLNLNIAEDGPNAAYFNNTAPSSTLFTLGNLAGINGSGNTIVAYCFAPVAGYSAFGSYTGNGSSDGPFVYTGFRPALVLVKAYSTAGYDWYLMDDKRPGYNVISNRLLPNLSNAEITSGDPQLDIVSNGFKLRTGNSNASSVSYIYMALAANPFKFSNAR